ncbi:hypothetical protein BCR39DRAFT_601385 [Naematelia encephala]|uniref:Uncharacterized protein n=1 Tax=Naematelia encephala TaxID=71784 RepID=A0A1Y2AEQ5_9TREE|nr:hypothetical protein BCR39DRAFT_601385 [Naematelia encephala]
MPRLVKVAAAQLSSKTQQWKTSSSSPFTADSGANRNHLTTFFPRYFITDEEELASDFESEVDGTVAQSRNVKAFFERRHELDDVQLGYSEVTEKGRYNAAVHRPCTVEPFDHNPSTTDQLEKRKFLPGNLCFNVFRADSLTETCGGASLIAGQLICNDGRWNEG